MKPKDIKRLMELLAKSSRSEAENQELAALQAKANALPDEAAGGGDAGNGKTADADDGALSPEQVKQLVTEAVTKASGDKLTADQVKTVVADALKAVPTLDQKALSDAVAEQVKKAVPSGISADDVKAIVTNALKADRKGSRMEHEAGGDDADISTPIAHRAGNMTVAFKQLLNVMLKRDVNDGIEQKVLSEADLRGERAEKRLFAQLAQKAITTSGAGTGAEFMNFSLSSVLLQRMYLESKLAAAMVASEVQMPTNPYTYPLSTTRPTFKTGAEAEDASESDVGTGSLILNAKKLIGMVPFSYEADEDSIIAILPHVITQLGEAAGESLEDAILNGDTAGTHQDSDIHAVTKHAAKLFNGIRKLALAQTALKVSFATGGVSTANIGALKKALGRWGLDPKKLLLVAGPNGYNDIVMLPETLTAEKAGNQATARIITGMAPNILGIDIVPSAKQREDLNASGVFDNTTTTKGSLTLIHKPSWILGVRRGFLVETETDKIKQQNYVIASFRRDFKPLESLANTRAAAVAYNYNA